jgi:hypothetical protein
MKKLRHSKFKNTGFLFELLVRQVTSDILSKDNSTAERVIKEYFNPKKELSKELKLYQYLINEKYNSEAKAVKFIDTICEARKRLDENKLNKEKYNLIKEIKKLYNIEDFVRSPISNYKTLASIYKIFESVTGSDIQYSPTEIVGCRFTIAENIINASIKNKETKLKDAALEEYKIQDDSIRAITYKLLIEKFNKKYANLTEQQRNLLTQYINNINNNGKLNDYIKKEVVSILSELQKINSGVNDKVTQIMLKESVSHLQKIKGAKVIKENHLSAIMLSYELLKELKHAQQK